MFVVDVTSHSNRWRSVNPVEKLVPAALLLVLVLNRPLLPTAPLVLATSTMAVCAGAGIPLGRWLKALSFPAGFIAVGSVGVALVAGDGPWLVPLTVTGSSLGDATGVALKSFAATSTIVFVGVTTPMVELITTLRSLRVPVVVTDLMMTTYRLMFELIETGRRLRLAQASRLGYVGLRRSVGSAAAIVGAVFIQSIHKAKRLQIGLDARGYEGELKVLCQTRPLRLLGITAGCSVGVLVLAISYLG